MEYLSASEMKERADNNTKVSDISELTKIFADKIFEQMMVSADDHKYEMDITINSRQRKINLVQSDCDIVASQIRDCLTWKGYTIGRLFIEKINTFDYWQYRLYCQISWKGVATYDKQDCKTCTKYREKALADWEFLEEINPDYGIRRVR